MNVVKGDLLKCSYCRMVILQEKNQTTKKMFLGAKKSEHEVLNAHVH